MASVQFEGVSHRRPGEFDAIVGFDLDIADGEVVAFVGGAGSGASTALRLLAGFEDAEHGTIRIGDRDLAGLAPRDRNVALVLPHHSLYPDQTAADHLLFPLVVSGVSARGRRRRMAAVADLLALGDLLDRRPGELTPAECQRVALGRAIVRGPEVLLVEEPLTGLDAPARIEVRDEIIRRRDDIAITIVAVVADPEDAAAIAHRSVRFGRATELVARPEHVLA